MVRDGWETGVGRTDGAVVPGSVIRDGVARGTDVLALAIAADTWRAATLDTVMSDTVTPDMDMWPAGVGSMGTRFMVAADFMAADSTVVEAMAANI